MKKFYVALCWSFTTGTFKVEFVANDDEEAKKIADSLLLSRLQFEGVTSVHTPGNSIPNGGIDGLFEDTSKRFVG